MQGILGKARQITSRPSFFFFSVKIRSHKVTPLFNQGSVHSGSRSRLSTSEDRNTCSQPQRLEHVQSTSKDITCPVNLKGHIMLCQPQGTYHAPLTSKVISCAVNLKDHIRSKHKTPNHKYRSDLLFMLHTVTVVEFLHIGI